MHTTPLFPNYAETGAFSGASETSRLDSYADPSPEAADVVCTAMHLMDDELSLRRGASSPKVQTARPAGSWRCGVAVQSHETPPPLGVPCRSIPSIGSSN